MPGLLRRLCSGKPARHELPDRTEQPIDRRLAPLVAIADRYDSNDLDDEARKYWGRDLENTNDKDPASIVLYTARGGGTLLTLAHCLKAREIVR